MKKAPQIISAKAKKIGQDAFSAGLKEGERRFARAFGRWLREKATVQNYIHVFHLQLWLSDRSRKARKG